MKKVTTPKNIPISFIVMTFFNIVASGMESPMTDIMKAMAQPEPNTLISIIFNFII